MALTKIEASNIAAGAVASSGLLGLVKYTGSGTYTPGGTSNGTAADEGSASVTKVIIEVQGGGGGGGQSGAATYRVAGSGGGYAKKFIDVSAMKSAGQTATITVGIGGPGATTSAAGTDGGDSKWESPTGAITLTVTGGKGVGAYASYGTAVGGSGTNGNINIKGQNGRNNSTGAAGDSQLGSGGWSGYSGEQAAEDGSGYGAGGGAGYSVNGGAGSAGIVLIWEYA